MRCIILDPAEKTVAPVDMPEDNLLPHIQAALRAQEVTALLVGPGTVMWINTRALLAPEPKLWGFDESQVLAGPAVFHGISPAAQLQDVPFEAQTLLENVTWRDDIRFAGFTEYLSMATTPQGFVPQVVRQPVYEPVPPPAAEPANDPGLEGGPVVELVTIYTRDGEYRAVRHRIGRGERRQVGEEEAADSLEAIRTVMELNSAEHTRFNREEADHPDLVETWLVT